MLVSYTYVAVIVLICWLYRESLCIAVIWSTWARIYWTRRTFTGIEKSWRYSTARLATISTLLAGLRHGLHVPVL